MKYSEYLKKVNGCYTGKAVGGTLGMPFEGSLKTRHLTFYEPVPTQMLPNDDLDMQVVALEIIRRFGLPVNRFRLSTMWEHLQDGGPDEYGPARWNIALGRFAPLSGYFNNKFYAGMGAAIRSELYACIAPGDPDLATRLSREDACTDHYADGMEACVFLAAVEAAAFVKSDARELIELGLSYIDPNGRLAAGIRDAIKLIDSTGDAYEARELFLEKYVVENFTDVTINLGFIVISWLASGGDFDKAICTAAGLGYDADCTCATLGSIIGIIDPDAISERWTAPIGDTLILQTSMMGIHEPETIGEFCDLVGATAVEVLGYYGSKELVLEEIPSGLAPMHKPWTLDTHAVDRMDSPREALIATNPVAVRLIYPEYVSVRPLEPSEFVLNVRNTTAEALSGRFTLNLPEGWKCEPSEFGLSLEPCAEADYRFVVTPGAMEKRRTRDNDLDIDFDCRGLTWVVNADLPCAIPWERTNLDTGEVELIDAREVFQIVPRGHWRYRVGVKVNPYMPVAMGVMSERAFTAKLNDKLVIEGDGTRYCPAFHRSRTVKPVTTDKLFGCWNFVEIEVLDGEPGELFFGLARPHNCREWLVGVEYSLVPLSYLS